MPLSTDHPAPRTLGALIEDRLGSLAAITVGSDLAEAILAGTHEITLNPEQLDDPLGTDRHAEWQTDDAFTALKESIQQNGQDMPIRVWPTDPAWRPDPLAPLDTAGTRFQIVAGRRRTAACAVLGRTVRAVIAPRSKSASPDETRFEMLCQRFRENDARENLSPFERLTSIAELFETRAAIEGETLNAATFAKSLGIAQSAVSRAKSLARNRAAIEAICETPHALSYRGIESAIARIERRSPKKDVGIKTRHEANGRTVKSSLAAAKLTITAPNVTLDATALESLTRTIAAIIPAKQK